jgi:hypothetical protein
MNSGMMPVMSDNEVLLFESLARCSDIYVEFGAGGSTLSACNLVRCTVLSAESSREWAGKVRDECLRAGTRITPAIHHVDIGPTRRWGYPDTENHKHLWCRYHQEIWGHQAAQKADLYFIDGRFRVACAMQILIRGDVDCTIAIHDFPLRQYYHVIRDFAREVANTGTLSVFRIKNNFDRRRAAAILEEYQYDPR